MKKIIKISFVLAVALLINVNSTFAFVSDEPDFVGGNDTIDNSGGEPESVGGNDTIDNSGDEEPEFVGGHDTIDTPSSDNGGSSDNNGGGSRSGSRRSSGGGSSVPSGAAVLGASTGPNGENLSCAPFLTTYMRIGQTNDVEEVKKLQTFLNEFNGEKLPVTGFFGELTYWAVRRLQAKYTNEILQPWVDAGTVNQLNPTGYVYKMTQWFINTHKCPDTNLPQPELK